MARENSEYTRVFQGIVQDRFLHRGKDKSDVGSVGGLRQAKNLLEDKQSIETPKSNLLRVEVQVSPVDLVKSPEQILGSLVNIVSTRIVWEIVAERGPTKLLLEDINLVEEEDNTGPHEPSRVDHRVEEQ